MLSGGAWNNKVILQLLQKLLPVNCSIASSLLLSVAFIVKFYESGISLSRFIKA